MEDLGLTEAPSGEGTGVAPCVLLCPRVPGGEASGHIVGEGLRQVGDGAIKLVTHGHVRHRGPVGSQSYN